MFIKLSRTLFYGYKNNANDSILKLIKNNNLIYIMSYLHINSSLKNISFFSINDMITSSGSLPKSGNGRNIEQFKNILSQLHEMKIIKLHEMDAKPNQFNYCEVLYNLDDNFIMVEEDIINKIIDFKSDDKDKVDNIKLFMFYCYIACRVYRRSKDMKDMVLNGGKPETCYFTYLQCYDDISLSANAINKYIKILTELDLIRVGNAGEWYHINDKHKRRQESCNTYVLYDANDNWKEELKESIRLYKKKYTDRVFDKKYKNNNRSDDGYINNIGKLERLGKATPEQIERRNELLIKKQKLTNEENILFTINALLDEPDNEGMTLSQIYQFQGKEKLSDKYFEIEQSLGLLDDEEENLTIDFAYYKWVITNYKDTKHDYYYNCVKKHIREMDAENREDADVV